jgi:adenylate kinase
MNIVLFGPPGCGKGTQAQRLQSNRGMIQLSTGQMLRNAIEEETELGVRVKESMAAGNLVDDETVIAMLTAHIDDSDCAKGFVLDGFPRTIPQADALGDMLTRKGMELNAVIQIVADDEALVERMAGRFNCVMCGEGYHDTFKPTKVAKTCDKCDSRHFGRRPDDSAESVRTRLEAYHEWTEPLMPYYQTRANLLTVDGLGGIEDVEKEINAVLDAV